MSSNEGERSHENGDHAFFVTIPKTIPVTIIIAIIIQIGVIIWAVSSYYKENEITKAAITEQFKTLQDELSSIKGSIYTRPEATVLERRVDKMEERVIFLERQGYDNGKGASGTIK